MEPLSFESYHLCCNKQKGEGPMMIIRTIHVSGQHFEGRQWKKAILHYLLGIASGDPSVTQRPKIRIADNTDTNGLFELNFGRYSNTNSVYWAEGATIYDDPPHDLSHEDTIVVGCREIEAEWGLARFVAHDKVKCLRIRLGSLRNLVFWKKLDGELGIAIEYRDENL
jgi:hypothetical protein